MQMKIMLKLINKYNKNSNNNKMYPQVTTKYIIK